MQVVLSTTLLLASLGLLHGLPVDPEPLFPTQENFDLTRFMGKWHDIAIASTCPWVQRHKADSAIGVLELLASSTESKVSMKRTMLRHGTCKVIEGEYLLTDTPGRFSYHNARWGSDADAYVVHTNYDEYAIVVMNKQKQDGEKSVSVKLYSRTMELRDTLIDDFRRLVKDQGMADDTVIIKQNKGECVPEETVAEPGVQRVRRNVVLPSLQEEESSGSEPFFDSTVGCKSAPDVGPCFGTLQRYFYNSTNMKCQLFTYGGCLGNHNNFVDERACLQSCRTEAACRLPMDASPCAGQPQVWAFDPKTGTCLAYKEGYCQGNSNKFYTKGECEEFCGMKEGDGEFLKVD